MQERAYRADEIESAISLEPRISGKINVEVDGRHVRLSGIVTSLEAREQAESIARNFGATSIDNDITIEATGPIEDTDTLSFAQETLASNPDLVHDIGVDRIVGGVAYLKGNAESTGKISQAAELVAKAHGVKDVVSEVRITTDVVITDEDLVSGVKQALRAEPTIHEEFIGITAKNGHVTLEGTVDNLMKKLLAGSIAKNLPGVVSVANNLSSAEMPSSFDQAVENEVIKALSLSAIDMTDVRVSVVGGLVFLDGTVGSYQQRDRARHVAEAVPGVTGVQNDLVIGFHIEKSA